MEKAFRIFCTALAVLACGCDRWVEAKYEVLSLDRPNPTTYVFPFAPEIVHATAKLAIETGKVTFDGVRSSVITTRDAGWENIARRKGIQEDSLDLYVISNAPDSSRVYFNPQKAILYDADYYVRLVPFSRDSTFVEVLTIRPTLLLGETFFSHLIPDQLGHGEVITKQVPPTSIEEYEILLMIGKGLQMIDNMPPIQMPVHNKAN